MDEKARPVSVCRVAGREFKIFRMYDEQVQTNYLTYPDFAEEPVYTAEGRPFTRSDYEGCELHKSDGCGGVFNECGNCAHFYREETPADIIGICVCEKLRNEKKKA